MAMLVALAHMNVLWAILLLTLGVIVGGVLVFVWVAHAIFSPWQR